MSCPESFTPYGGGCVRACPTTQGFEQRTDGGQAKCVYTADPTKVVNLTTVSDLPARAYRTDEPFPPPPTLDSLQADNPRYYAIFKTEADRVDTALKPLLDSIDKQSKIDTAFQGLLAAENNRDNAPDAYGAARVAYYTLLRGPEWIETEKERVTKAEVDPEVARYRTAHDDVASQQAAQQQTQDTMNSVKDGVLSLKDDFQYTTDLFKDQIENLKNQINLERRGRSKPESEEKGFFPWIDLILNVCIIAGLIFAGLTFARKLYYRASPYASPVGFIGPRLPYV